MRIKKRIARPDRIFSRLVSFLAGWNSAPKKESFCLSSSNSGAVSVIKSVSSSAPATQCCFQTYPRLLSAWGWTWCKRSLRGMSTLEATKWYYIYRRGRRRSGSDRHALIRAPDIGHRRQWRVRVAGLVTWPSNHRTTSRGWLGCRPVKVWSPGGGRPGVSQICLSFSRTSRDSERGVEAS